MSPDIDRRGYSTYSMAVPSQEQLQQFQMAAALAAAGTGCCGGANRAATLTPLVVFKEPVSELTCNLSGSRKRVREEPTVLPTSNSAVLNRQQQLIILQKQQLLLLNQIHSKTTLTNTELPVEGSRFIQSAMTSTSGRPAELPSASPAEASLVSSVCHNKGNNVAGGISSPSLISMLHHHRLEVDALVRLHAEKLRSGLEEARKHQYRAVAAAMEQQAQRRVAEKQAELEAATKRNTELEERLRQVAAESQAWFTVAKNSEALVAGLRASLEQALLRKLSGASNSSDTGVDLPGAWAEKEEGYGDSEEEGGTATRVSYTVLDAEASSLTIGAARNNTPQVGGYGLPCRSCGKADACVLILPCRHLCLCPTCEPSAHECTVCGGRKNGTLQINLS